MRITSPHGANNYIPGDYYRICDVCGFKYRQSEMLKRWDNVWVCSADFEPRHPQEFLRGKNEHIAAHDPRPDTSDAAAAETEEIYGEST